MLFCQFSLNKLFYICIKRYNTNMDKRDLTVIENKTMTKDKSEVKKERMLQTNPIVKKLAKFHHEKAETFSVKDLFKK